MIDATIIERADPAIEPGVYLARSGAQAFGVLRALVTAGYARQLGERYLVDGERAIVVEVGDDMRPNQEGEEGALQMGPEFFVGALDDYRNWREAWWREAIQNGVDAGATEITCAVSRREDGTWEVSCEDNGAGMTRDTLRNVFMRLKGTAKAGGTGGFGEAKRLLVLPWISYELHTRDTLMRGAGGSYKTFDAPERRGTRLTVVMPADNATSADLAVLYIAKCQLPGVRFNVIGATDEQTGAPSGPQRIRAGLRPGELIRSLEGVADLYYDKRKTAKKYEGMVVRMQNVAQGYSLAMFVKRVPDEVQGQLVLEITARSTEVLASNRDGFRGNWGSLGQKLEYALEAYASELAADVKSALKKKAGLIDEKFLMGKKFQAEVPDIKAHMLDRLGAIEPAGKDGLSLTQIDKLMGVLAEFQEERKTVERVHVGPEAFSAGESRAELAKAMLEGLPVEGSRQIEAIIAQLAWEPDFFLTNTIEGYKVPKRFYPEHMTAPVRKMMKTWAELCKFVMMQLGSAEQFGVGIVIDDETGAQYRSDQDGHWLLLNPFVKADPRVDDGVWMLSDWEHFMWMYAAAVHECTHLVDSITAHNEYFASALTRNFARCSGKEKQLRKIKSIVLASERAAAEQRRAERGPRAARAAKASGPREVGFIPPQEGSKPFVALTGGAPYEQLFEGPEWYGDFKGVVLFDPDANTKRWEIADTRQGILFRLDPSAQGEHEPDLVDIMRQAWGSRDPTHFVLERSLEYAEIGDFYLRKVLEDRWVYPD